MAMEHIRDVLQRIPAILMGMYESPAEECLGERLRMVITPATTFQTQVWVNTFVGRFRLDMLLIDKNGRRIAIEVDGKDFHEASKDHWRTVFIVGDRQVDVVYRVSASDLKINLVGILAGLSVLEPQCFNPSDILRWREIVNSIYLNNSDDESDRHDDSGRLWSKFWTHSNTAIENHFYENARECGAAAIEAYHRFAMATGLGDLDAIHKEWELTHPSKPANDVSSDLFEFFEYL